MKAGAPKTTPFSDIDLKRWKEYPTVLTDSLWLMPERGKSGSHDGDYWGNFIPQIATQALCRFSKPGEIVLDPFLGSGTTLIECRRLGRHGIGIDLNGDVAKKARKRIASQENPHGITTAVITGDSRSGAVWGKVRSHLGDIGSESIQLLILHPPYHDIIRFSESQEDLSNAPSLMAFCDSLSEIVRKASALLEPGRYLVLVIGDKYARGEWVPLGFEAMQVVIREGFQLKSICVKDIQENRGKRNQLHLWKYRALAGGFYVFKHEYIMFFVKR